MYNCNIYKIKTHGSAGMRFKSNLDATNRNKDNRVVYSDQWNPLDKNPLWLQ